MKHKTDFKIQIKKMGTQGEKHKTDFKIQIENMSTHGERSAEVALWLMCKRLNHVHSLKISLLDDICIDFAPHSDDETTVLNPTWRAQLVQDCVASVGAVRNSLTISC